MSSICHSVYLMLGRFTSMGNSNSTPARKCRDRDAGNRAMAKSILEEDQDVPEGTTHNNRLGALGRSKSVDSLHKFTRPPNWDGELPIQPDKSGLELEQNPPPHLRREIREADARLKAARAATANENGAIDTECRAQNLKRARDPSDQVTHRNEEGSKRKSRRTPLFDIGLHRWGLGLSRNAEIYDYYRRLDREGRDDTSIASENNLSLLREILEDDARAREEGNNTKVTQWIQKREIAEGGFARVYLWEKKSIDGGPSLRMAVKDSQPSYFWQDYHAEGTLIRKLNNTGCKNVITVLDWLYKPASPSHDAFIRTCYEYAEHGDLADVIRFYKAYQLVIPEAFIWHVFQSTANALCYCRHGTNKSNTTIPNWHNIIHGDVKPANLLLTHFHESTDSLYPTIKLGDFGMAYSVQESNPKLRAWKSTFRYGTDSFMAPEIETLDRRAMGNFDPVPPSKIHGSHSDIWSLGAVIEKLMSTRFSAVKDHPEFDSPYVEKYYSARLQSLVARCKSYSIRSRPSIYDVYLRTQKGVAELHDTAMEEVSHTPANRPSHSQVLFSKADQARFKEDRAFRNAYIKANRTPLLRGKTPPPQRKENTPKPAAPLSSSNVPVNQRHGHPSSTQPSIAPSPSRIHAARAASNLENPEQSIFATNPPIQSHPGPLLPSSVSPSLHTNIDAANPTNTHSQSQSLFTTDASSAQSPALILPDINLATTSSDLPSPKTPPPIPTQTKPRSPQFEQQQQQHDPQPPPQPLHTSSSESPPKSKRSNSTKETSNAEPKNEEKQPRRKVVKKALKISGPLRRSKRLMEKKRVRFDIDGE